MSQIGGLVGMSDAQAEVTASFWDVDLSGQSSSAGGTGKTTAQLHRSAPMCAQVGILPLKMRMAQKTPGILPVMGQPSSSLSKGQAHAMIPIR